MTPLPLESLTECRLANMMPLIISLSIDASNTSKHKIIISSQNTTCTIVANAKTGVPHNSFALINIDVPIH